MGKRLTLKSVAADLRASYRTDEDLIKLITHVLDERAKKQTNIGAAQVNLAKDQAKTSVDELNKLVGDFLLNKVHTKPIVFAELCDRPLVWDFAFDSPPQQAPTTKQCDKHKICNHYIDGVLCDSIVTSPLRYIYTPKPAPKHNYINHAAERCDTVFQSVKNALRLMTHVTYERNNHTTFIVKSKYSHTFEMSVVCEREFIHLAFRKRSGQLITERYTRNSDAAASIAATVMFYCMKNY